ncbi:hypothetical protein KL933_002541 [Ogataea haglerorum]|uniref:Major facilitator superfamily (MFS) profile domain-containing protein n=1 Tax=Ogataea haglerorum TaxID=1937702 RepID=A0AAN6I0I1_9ASCO|nr:uncharacterized protein KL911_003133 [Ogataea haglerorum]KAG7727607.1 hypothetical protein KL933_002541 [Ogataea haglerorum]KAG7747360.1 hypothetical protein KL912_003384 [Ogataea haglerorum]KAG7753028.1 hypothetical protein KL911_003133 [Ogataea haglerorum]
MKERSDNKSKETVSQIEINPVLSTVVSLDGREIEIHQLDADVALQYHQDAMDLVLDPQFERKLLRKIDWCLMPVIAALMSCQLMDKTTNSYASIMNLQKDLNMSDKEYSWVGSAFYFGYLIFQFPANLLLQKLPLSKTLGTAVIIWGIVLMCHAACSNAAGFLVCRVILGIFEGFMNPAYVLLTSQWYRKSEQFMRASIWWGFQGFGTLLGAGIAYGLAVHRSGNYSFASWRMLYIITGIITIFLGVLSIVHVPDLPVKAWFLNETEKKYCVERVKGNQQGFGSHKFKRHQVLEALQDPVLYLFFIYGMSYAIPNGGFTNFGSILLKGDFGFSTQNALLMGMPGGAIDIVFPISVAYLTYRFLNNRRLISSIIVQLIAIIGMCCLNFAGPRGWRLFGYLSFYMATSVSASMVSVLSSNVAGSTKKVTLNTFYLVGYCVGNIIGPQTFISSQKPGYVGAKTAMLVSFAAGLLCIVSLLLLYTHRNRIRDQKRAALGDKYQIPDTIAFADLTDIENPEFRYSL